MKRYLYVFLVLCLAWRVGRAESGQVRFTYVVVNLSASVVNLECVDTNNFVAYFEMSETGVSPDTWYPLLGRQGTVLGYRDISPGGSYEVNTHVFYETMGKKARERGRFEFFWRVPVTYSNLCHTSWFPGASGWVDPVYPEWNAAGVTRVYYFMGNTWTNGIYTNGIPSPDRPPYSSAANRYLKWDEGNYYLVMPDNGAQPYFDFRSIPTTPSNAPAWLGGPAGQWTWNAAPVTNSYGQAWNPVTESWGGQWEWTGGPAWNSPFFLDTRAVSSTNALWPTLYTTNASVMTDVNGALLRSSDLGNFYLSAIDGRLVVANDAVVGVADTLVAVAASSATIANGLQSVTVGNSLQVVQDSTQHVELLSAINGIASVLDGQAIAGKLADIRGAMITGIVVNVTGSGATNQIVSDGSITAVCDRVELTNTASWFADNPDEGPVPFGSVDVWTSLLDTNALTGWVIRNLPGWHADLATVETVIQTISNSLGAVSMGSGVYASFASIAGSGQSRLPTLTGVFHNKAGGASGWWIDIILDRIDRFALLLFSMCTVQLPSSLTLVTSFSSHSSEPLTLDLTRWETAITAIRTMLVFLIVFYTGWAAFSMFRSVFGSGK